MAGLLDFIGNTPLVEITHLNPNPAVKIYAKLEGHNPGGSVKDRAALSLIKGAMERGEIKPGDKLIEATSGNTGIALAMIARLFGLEIELVMPDNSTKERVLTMEAFGAKVILTPASISMEGARDYAENKVKEGGYITTGPEIWKDTEGKITHFVSSMGTTGTIMGVSRFLKEKNAAIQIVGVQPDEKARIPGIRRWPVDYMPKIFEAHRIDRTMDVSEVEAIEMTRSLAKREAIFAGMSSGGAMATAIKLAKELKEGVIVAIICDRGDRYLSSDLFGS
jgi:cysteine synthase B